MLRSQLPLYALLLLACGGLNGIERDPSEPGSAPVSSGQTSQPGQPGQPEPGVALPPVEANPPPDPCREPTPTPAPQGCVMGRLACGDRIAGNNEFGNANFDDDFYQGKFCTPLQRVARGGLHARRPRRHQGGGHPDQRVR